jgi:hypothetical protein
MRNLTRFLVLASLVAATVSCGDVVRTGRSPAYLVIDSLLGIRGATTLGTPTATLLSDVITNVTSPPPCSQTAPCPTIFNDPGQVVMHIALKDPGTAATPTVPSSVNSITITRYHVKYVRADGRQQEGVDVPYAFDGATTVTVAATSSTVGFELVRHVAKEESPLVQLKTSSQIITVIAEVTFYGTDQAGNEVSVMGKIQIDMGNFGDPA